MQIISNKRLHFVKGNVVGKPGENAVRNVEEEIIVNADTRPQIVPEWVADTDLYKAAVDDDSIIEVKSRNSDEQPTSKIKEADASKAKGIPEAEVVKTQQPAQQAEQTGWGAKG